MIEQLLQQLNLTSILLIVTLIAAIVIAYKVMEMIFDTILISGISAAFYIGLRTLQGGNIALNDLLLFTVLGSAIYMIYSLLASIYKLGTTIIPIPIHIIQAGLKPVRYAGNKIKELADKKEGYAPKQNNAQKKKKQKQKEDQEDKKGKTTKEVILSNQKQDKDEE